MHSTDACCADMHCMITALRHACCWTGCRSFTAARDFIVSVCTYAPQIPTNPSTIYPELCSIKNSTDQKLPAKSAADCPHSFLDKPPNAFNHVWECRRLRVVMQCGVPAKLIPVLAAAQLRVQPVYLRWRSRNRFYLTKACLSSCSPGMDGVRHSCTQYE